MFLFRKGEELKRTLMGIIHFQYNLQSYEELATFPSKKGEELNRTLVRIIDL
jgi:hypothetical protein